MDKLKQEIVAEYEAWVDLALEPLVDGVGIKNIAVENFKLKLNKLIEYAHTIKCGENPTNRL